MPKKQQNQSSATPVRTESGQNLYTRRGDIVKGPFPRGLIRNYVLLGRLELDDEVSSDQEFWEPIRNIPSLIPKEMREVTSLEDRIRLEQARRRQDERTYERRVEEKDRAREERRRGDRRQDEADDIVAHRQRRVRQRTYRPRRKWVMAVVMLLIVFGGLGYLTWISIMKGPPPPVVAIDCSAKPVPGVNWSHCKLPGVTVVTTSIAGAILSNADLRSSDFHGTSLAGVVANYANFNQANLSYTDFTGARLTGTSFYKTDLSNSNFTGADLSYADFRGAQMGGVILKGANLSRAIWIDGSRCKAGSIGQCNKPGSDQRK